MGRCEYLFEIEGDIYEVLLPARITPEELDRRLDEKALEEVYWCWERIGGGRYAVQLGANVFEVFMPEELTDKKAEELIKEEVLKRIDRRVIFG